MCKQLRTLRTGSYAPGFNYLEVFFLNYKLSSWSLMLFLFTSTCKCDVHLFIYVLCCPFGKESGHYPMVNVTHIVWVKDKR